MSRDSIIDEAAEKTDKQTEADDDDDAEEEASDTEERERLTQRVPTDLLEDVERVQEKYHLPSRNAAINFMLNASADDLLDNRGE
jgi:hypothetical protein